MNKKKINNLLNYIKYSCMILVVLFSAYIYFFEEDIFCVTSQGQADLEDLGTKCFRTLNESNEYKLYLIDKYDIGKQQELNYNFTINFTS